MLKHSRALLDESTSNKGQCINLFSFRTSSFSDTYTCKRWEKVFGLQFRLLFTYVFYLMHRTATEWVSTSILLFATFLSVFLKLANIY